MNHKAASTSVIKVGSMGHRQKMDQNPKIPFYQQLATGLQRSHLTPTPAPPRVCFLSCQKA